VRDGNGFPGYAEFSPLLIASCSFFSMEVKNSLLGTGTDRWLSTKIYVKYTTPVSVLMTGFKAYLWQLKPKLLTQKFFQKRDNYSKQSQPKIITSVFLHAVRLRDI